MLLVMGSDTCMVSYVMGLGGDEKTCLVSVLPRQMAKFLWPPPAEDETHEVHIYLLKQCKAIPSLGAQTAFLLQRIGRGSVSIVAVTMVTYKEREQRKSDIIEHNQPGSYTFTHSR